MAETTATTSGSIAMWLNEARRTRQQATGEWMHGEQGTALVHHMPRLLAAVEAVLAQHQPGRVVIVGALCPQHEAHRNFSITAVEAASVVACPDCPASVWNSCTGCGPQMPVDSCPARKAISAALLREDS